MLPGWLHHDLAIFQMNSFNFYSIKSSKNIWKMKDARTWEAPMQEAVLVVVNGVWCLMYAQRKASAVELKRLKRLLNNFLYICDTAIQETIANKSSLELKVLESFWEGKLFVYFQCGSPILFFWNLSKGSCSLR